MGDPMSVKGMPLKPEFMRAYILEIPGRLQPYKRSEIIEWVTKRHFLLGGVDGDAKPDRQIKRVLKDLVNQGLLKQPYRGYYKKTGKVMPVMGDPVDVKGMPLKPEFMRTYILNEMPDREKPYERREIVEWVITYHRSRGGIDSDTEPNAQIKKVLKELVEQGLLERPYRGYYKKTGKVGTTKIDNEFLDDLGIPSMKSEIPAKEETKVAPLVVEIGTGRECVYGWYLPAYRKLAELEDRGGWPIKIGRTEGNPEKRILDSTGFSPEQPAIAFLHRVNDSYRCEKWYHVQLDARKRKIDKAKGQEWFFCDLSVLKELGDQYEKILLDVARARKRGAQ